MNETISNMIIKGLHYETVPDMRYFNTSEGAGRRLSDMDLSCMHLTRENLSFCNLRNSNLDHSDLRFADFRCADARGASFYGTNMSCADVSNMVIDDGAGNDYDILSNKR